MPTLQAMVAGVIGYGMVLVLTLILGIQGADLGIPTCAISTSTFGRKGTRLLVSSLFTVSLVGFFGLQVNVCGEAFSTLALAAFGVEIPVVASSIFWGMVMVVIAVWEMETLKNLDTISVPLLLLIMIVGTVMAFRIYGSAGLSANEVETPTMSMIEGKRRDPGTHPDGDDFTGESDWRGHPAGAGDARGRRTRARYLQRPGRQRPGAGEMSLRMLAAARLCHGF